jgi:hypothetical protein
MKLKQGAMLISFYWGGAFVFQATLEYLQLPDTVEVNARAVILNTVADVDNYTLLVRPK